jgi:hypothetical protein
LLVATGRQTQIESGVIVQNSQWMTSAGALVAEGEVAFEVHLPKHVGLSVLKPFDGGVLAIYAAMNLSAMAAQNRVDCAGVRMITVLGQ